MFYERITRPLKSLYDNYGVSEKTLIIIDALDEEKLDESGNSIVSVLKTLNSDPLFPKNIRFLITTRSVDYIVKSFSGQKSFDLSGELNTKDIKNYISKKLKKEISNKDIEKIIISKLIRKIEKSKNKNNENFLYWSLFIEFILQHKNEKELDSILEDLPSGINEMYSKFLERICDTKNNEWKNNYQDLLGIIALQQGQGFSGLLLRKILKRKNENVDINSNISKLRQFVDGNYTIIPGLDLPKGPFHIFHKSFADFLLNEENNNQSFKVNTLNIHKLLVEYCKDKINKINNENDHPDVEDYFIQYLSYHIYQLINNYWKLIENPDVKDIMNELKNEEKKYRKLLYELTVDQSFHQKQKEILDRDNSLVLSTIRFAISSAILSDDAPSIAKFMMIHAKKILDTKKQSPIEILRNDQPLENAWNIADLYNSSNSSLWYLLLAWELKEKGKIEDAKKTLQKLVKKDKQLITISNHFKAILFEMLPHIYEIDKEIFNFLLKKLININVVNIYDIIKLCNRFLNKGYLNISIQILQNIKDDYIKSKAIAAIAQTVAKFDDKDMVMTCIGKLVEIVDKMQDDSYHKPEAIAAIAQAVAKFDKDMVDKDMVMTCIDTALEIASKMPDDSDKSKSIAAIAQAVATFDDKDMAMTCIGKLVEIVDKMQDDHYKSKAIAAVVQTQSKIGLFSDSIENIKKILVDRDRYLAQIIYNMVKSGDNRYFKKLITECSYYISSTYTTIGILFYCYKDQRKDLSEIIFELIQ